MSEKSNKKLAAVKAVSVAVDLSEKIGRRLRVDAALNGLSPQDQLRKMIGLSYKKPQRPRVTLSLREEDYGYLGERYGVKTTDTNEIKKSVINEISNILHKK
ncbi:MAG: hypothetical protein JKY45_14625 [Emcibacter sp.]|nr:hypothetical protein [Emcibacter sp.]